MPVLSEVSYTPSIVKLLVDGRSTESRSSEFLPVMNPATGAQISRVPLALKEEIESAIVSSQIAFGKWKEVPVPERIQLLFRMRYVFEEHFEELVR